MQPGLPFSGISAKISGMFTETSFLDSRLKSFSRLRRPALALLMVFAGGFLAGIPAAGENESDRFRNHGIAAPSGQAGWGGVVVTEDADGTPLIVVHLWTGSGPTEERSLLLVNAETGESEQVALPRRRGAGGFGIWLSNDRYFYTTVADQFVAFDIHEREWFFTHPVPDRMVMRFTENDEGTIYFGMYPNAEIFSFDPANRELREYGPIAEEDWAQYPHLATDDTGWVYVGIRHHLFNLLALDPDTGERTQLIDDATREGVGNVRNVAIWRAENGRVYARPALPDGFGDWYELYEGAARVVDEPAAAQKSYYNHPHRHPMHFPGGGRVAGIDVSNRTATIESAGGERRRIDFDYESAGVRIYSVQAGPDGRIFGSTGIPLRFFRYDPVTEEMEDWGLGGNSGHVNDLISLGDRLYGAVYSSGALIEYDPVEPWEDTSLHRSENPKALFSREERRELFGRPYVLFAHSDGEHLLLGGNAMRSVIGGGIFVYNLSSGESRVLDRTDLIPDQGVMSMAELPGGDILVGATARAPTGGEQVAEAGSMYILQWPGLEMSERIDPRAGLEVRDLIAGPDGRVFGVTHRRELFVFDPESRGIVERVSLAEYGPQAGGQAPRVMLFGPDGALYILMAEAIVRLDPETLEHRREAEAPSRIHAGITLHEGRLYFSSGSELWSYRLPGGE